MQKKKLMSYKKKKRKMKKWLDKKGFSTFLKEGQNRKSLWERRDLRQHSNQICQI